MLTDKDRCPPAGLLEEIDNALLPAEQRQALADHAERCHKCSAVVQAGRRLSALLHTADPAADALQDEKRLSSHRAALLARCATDLVAEPAKLVTAIPGAPRRPQPMGFLPNDYSRILQERRSPIVAFTAAALTATALLVARNIPQDPTMLPPAIVAQTAPQHALRHREPLVVSTAPPSPSAAPITSAAPEHPAGQSESAEARTRPRRRKAQRRQGGGAAPRTTIARNSPAALHGRPAEPSPEAPTHVTIIADTDGADNLPSETATPPVHESLTLVAVGNPGDPTYRRLAIVHSSTNPEEETP